MQLNHYNNKNILVIGASFGIGAEIVTQLDKYGANLAMVARSLDKMQQLQQNLSKNHIAVKCDITDHKDLIKLRSAIYQKWHKIDIIIFCAGTYQPMNVENFDLDIAQNIIKVNFTSFINFFDVFSADFKNKKISHLAIISSIAGYFGMNNSLAYGASKAALSHFAESLFLELKKYGVKTQLINPGFVKTRLTDQNNFNMPFIISSKKAAQIIIKQLPKNQFEIKFPMIFTYIMKFIAILPYKLKFFLLKYVK